MVTAQDDRYGNGRGSAGSTDQVVSYVRTRIESGALRPGDRLPAERELAVHIGVSRPTVRAGLKALAAIGVVQARRGSGTYIPDGPPALGSEPLSFLAALHGFSREEMYEARRILEVGAAGLAAERATAVQVEAIGVEVRRMFSAVSDPHRFLVHDINFHRAIAAASGNPIVASLVEMVSVLYYERRRRVVARASFRDLEDAARMHERIFDAISQRHAENARALMSAHLIQASQYQSQEPEPRPSPPSPPRNGRRSPAHEARSR
jgi:GntR family transcriptional regulator, transcriptional repressor for pyruvate dehydrogenase complex